MIGSWEGAQPEADSRCGDVEGQGGSPRGFEKDCSTVAPKTIRSESELDVPEANDL